jgi:hypothetical protein
MRRNAATSLGGVSEVVGEVVHVCDVTSELKYVVVRGVAGMLDTSQTYLYFLCSMLVLHHLLCVLLTLHGVFMHFLELTY